MRVDPNLSSLLNVGIQGTEQALNTAVQQVATGQRIGVPSDDPAAAAANLQSLAESANVDRYTKNGDAVLSQAQTADSAPYCGLNSREPKLGTDEGVLDGRVIVHRERTQL